MTRKDTRVTMKLDRELWNKMEQLIGAHPEWGILSVPEYVRRAIDADLRSRTADDSARAVRAGPSRGAGGKRCRSR